MSYDLMLQKALALHDDGKFDDAEMIYRQILQVAPQNPNILNLLGLIAQEKKSHNQAVAFFSEAEKYSRDNYVYLFNLAFSLLQIGKIPEALNYFTKVLALSPDLKEALYFKGICFEKQNDKQNARKYYLEALDKDAQYFEPKLALALLDNSIDKLILLDEEIADNSLIKINISKKYFEDGNLGKAILFARRAYELNPCNDEIAAFYALLLSQSDCEEKALSIYQEALVINPSNVNALINYANLLSRHQFSVDAEMLYRQAIDIEPDNFDAHLNLANLLYEESRIPEALEEYRKAVMINPKNQVVSRNLAMLLKDQKEYEEALGLFFNAFDEKNSDEISVSISETLSLLAIDDKEKALRIAENWQKSMPENVFAKHILSALKGEIIEDNKIYSEHLFDCFADNYDEVLQKIEYSVVSKIALIIKDLKGPIADLGCGSGLLGRALKTNSLEIIGVDISSKMLEKARKTKKYKKLIKSDVIKYLKSKPEVEVLVVADVLCYFGDLEEFFKLASGYKLCFSTEALENSNKNYVIMSSGRYAHNKKYVEKLLKEYGFENIKCKMETIRKENGCPVNGYIFSAGI